MLEPKELYDLFDNIDSIRKEMKHSWHYRELTKEQLALLNKIEELGTSSIAA